MSGLSDAASLKILSSFQTLLSGEDQVNNWLQTVDGAFQYQIFRPLTVADTTSYGTAYGLVGLPIGVNGGQAGDYLKALQITVNNPGSSRIALQDGASTVYTSSGTGTTFTNATTINFGMGSTTLSVTAAAALIGKFLICTAVVSGTPVLLARKIIGATATSGTSPNLYTTLTVDSLVTNGVTPSTISTTAGQASIASLIEVMPQYSQGAGAIPFGLKSTIGPWRLFVDGGVTVTAIGKFY